MSHPLLDIHQRHSVVDEFNRFRVSKRMGSKMEDVSIRSSNLLFFCQNVEGIADSSRKQWAPCTSCMDRRKQVAFGIVLIRVLFGDVCNLRLDQKHYLIRNRDLVAKNFGFLNIPTEK